MGQWGNKPYDNDAAADWFGHLTDVTNIRTHWLAGIRAGLVEEAQVVRAAVWLFVQLGHVYVWPIKTYKTDLELTITAVEKLRHLARGEQRDKLADDFSEQYNTLVARQKKNSEKA